MARPIEFDRSKAVDKAVGLFWRKGYQASSLSDLLAVMGIGRSSFYAAFTDKRSLFIECLDLFAERTLGLLARACADKPPVDALEGFFEGGLFGGRDERRQWGCLLVNTVLEMSGVDDDLAAHAGRHLDRVQDAFRAGLEHAGAAPALAQDLAAMLMLVNEGVRVSSRRASPQAAPPPAIAAIFRLVRNAIGCPSTLQITREIAT
ncbi:MAG: TetR/AcrR family transcriptional regulator [Phenylobacterium sp.]|uniref:TetR/AcrR family transcriptional regulator n=1 Tax=Phenylobacterium sp. TaxID=1871053 RepID=UPI001A40C834|nr:TetR/AcrR family transcriptional regulator [Phenylobacterium sp.]MBL8773628.1 TetR/AcrR family transcriptional regulator [Phenylobacterium sp.]